MSKKKRWYKPVRIALPLIYSALLFTAVIYKSFTLILIFFASSLIFGSFHCGWLCPFGLIQDLASRLARLLKLPRIRIPRSWDKYLRFMRYILLGLSFAGLGFTYYLNQPYGATMSILSGYAGSIEIAAWLLLGSFIVLSLFTERFFCRYFCTEGAQYGLLSMGRLFSIRRSESSCINCGACDKACPMGIKVSDIKHVRNGQCTNCFECIEACPVNNTLTYGWVFSKGDNKNEND